METRELTQLAHASGDMTAQEAERLEAYVDVHPADARGRAKLLGYYFLNYGLDPRARQRHVAWFVANSPRADIAGSPYCSLHRSTDTEWDVVAGTWRAHIEEAPEDAELLANARDWFTLRDREMAVALAERVVELTGTPEARMKLAHIHGLSAAGSGGSPEDTSARGRRVLDALGDPPVGGAALPTWLQSAAWAALAAGDLHQAQEFADELLALAVDDAWYTGNAHHHGHLVRGHIALSRGDVDTAEAGLRAAAATRGSPQLNSFGPNLSLAHSLLGHGRRAAVIAFLEDCRRFWAPPARRGEVQSPVASRNERTINHWIAAIEDGGTPDFGANLVYGR